jgi:hypothetical protein
MCKQGKIFSLIVSYYNKSLWNNNLMFIILENWYYWKDSKEGAKIQSLVDQSTKKDNYVVFQRYYHVFRQGMLFVIHSLKI